MDFILNKYHSEIGDFKTQIEQEKRKVRAILFARLLFFVGALTVFFYFVSTQPLLAWGILLLTVILFLYLLRMEAGTSRRVSYLQNRISFNEQEIERLHSRFDACDEGNEFRDREHLFSADLDLFGRRSLFQFINRTSTRSGRNLLAAWLTNPLSEKEEIEERQRSVADLASEPEWCHHFVALGKENKETGADKQTIENWLNEKDVFSTTTYAILSVLLPIAGIGSVVGYFAGWLPAWPIWTGMIIQGQIILSKLSTINTVHDQLSRKFDAIEKYAALIAHIESQPFTTPGLDKLQQALRGTEGTSSSSISQLRQLSNLLDARKNLVVAPLVDGFLLWDINILRRIESWRRSNRENFLKWIEIIAGFDAYISLGLHAYNHPEYAWPVVETGDFSIEAKKMGHPLIDSKKLVTNSYQCNGATHIDLLTGANMAGKSTFLRTIGVNLCLAMMGAPVCAASFRFRPVMLFTSLRTNDSLQENESFFHAELKRLLLLIQEYEAGKSVFFLLDEILKGTNSKDQHDGSLALCRKILRMHGTGIVATHDVELAPLSEEYPGQVRNLCFEITIIDDKLNFDYTLREGVCRTMNASFLMKKMGVIDP